MGSSQLSMFLFTNGLSSRATRSTSVDCDLRSCRFILNFVICVYFRKDYAHIATPKVVLLEWTRLALTSIILPNCLLYFSFSEIEHDWLPFRKIKFIYFKEKRHLKTCMRTYDCLK